MPSPPDPDPRRGEIYWLDWHPARGSEQAGRRPGVIVSMDPINRSSRVVIVAAVTSRIARRPYAFHVSVARTAENGLRSDSIVLCEQLMTVAKERLYGRLGSVSPTVMDEIDDALRVALALG